MLVVLLSKTERWRGIAGAAVYPHAFLWNPKNGRLKAAFTEDNKPYLG
jgi:hypothetical protein